MSPLSKNTLCLGSVLSIVETTVSDYSPCRKGGTVTTRESANGAGRRVLSLHDSLLCLAGLGARQLRDSGLPLRHRRASSHHGRIAQQLHHRWLEGRRRWHPADPPCAARDHRNHSRLHGLVRGGLLHLHLRALGPGRPMGRRPYSSARPRSQEMELARRPESFERNRLPTPEVLRRYLDL